MKKLFKPIVVVLVIFAFALHCKAGKYNQYYRDLSFNALEVPVPIIPNLNVSIVEYGGVGDGVTLNTQAFSSAITDLSNSGGGHLIVPEGVWLTGPIVLKSNIDLHVVKNAIVLFTPDKTQYPLTPPDAGTSGTRYQSPISAHYESNFSITGEGIFDGNGEHWRPVKRIKVSDVEWNSLLKKEGVAREDNGIWYPWVVKDKTTHKDDFASLEKLAKKRPRMLRFVACENILLQGVVFQNSPSFHVNMVLCHDIIIDGIMVRCPWNAQNGDGIDLSSCSNALIVNCSVDAGDDAICLKSGIGDAGRQRGPCSNIVIDNCTVFHGHGGFVIGSDTGGGMNNISVKNCRFIDTDTGVRFKSKRGRGGNVSNVFIDSIVMSDIANAAISFDSYYQEKTPFPDKAPEGGEISDVPYVAINQDTPSFKDIHISNIVCRDAGRALYINGLPEMNVKNVFLTNCIISAATGAQIDEASELRIENIHLDIAQGETFSFNNSKNIEINHVTNSGNGEETIRVSGSRNKNIRIKRSSFTLKNVVSTPKAKTAITID
ncbi:glycoside hydrolase family 28 protein [Bacteroides sp. 214]|uniref:glycoside hydrolase family 28 protein n=1 Tax=Bacteroides sp. 214 TaxID=2302935 RepID=UPI0013D80AF2|nr:glycoside hydrolase family 28 protein [Bacteroides sp. 214]